MLRETISPPHESIGCSEEHKISSEMILQPQTESALTTPSSAQSLIAEEIEDTAKGKLQKR